MVVLPRNHLVADRFRRMWGIMQKIADEPGHTRAELAGRFYVSERQIQADLNLIRNEMGMPLVRANGYRFVDDDGSPIASLMSFADVLLLCRIMVGARRDFSIPASALTSLIGKTTRLVPPHLRQLAAQLLDPTTRPIHGPLTQAMLSGGRVLLTWRDEMGTAEAVVKPELLFPYQGRWYVLGTVKQSGKTRDRMLPLEFVVRAEPIHQEDNTRGAA